MKPHQPTVHLISLGCPRTLVDSELYLGTLQQAECSVEERGDLVAEPISNAECGMRNAECQKAAIPNSGSRTPH